MSFIDTIKSWFSSPKPIVLPKNTNDPLNIRPNSLVSASNALKLTLQGESVVGLPGDTDKVVARGLIDLKEGVKMHRFYFEDEDLMLQVYTTGYAENVVDNVIMFNYDAYTVIPAYDDTELMKLMGPETGLGLPEFTYNGNTYQRRWGSEEGMTDFRRMDEYVTSEEAENKLCEHTCMLYARPICGGARDEFLVISREESMEDGEKTRGVSVAIGVTVFPNELTVL